MKHAWGYGTDQRLREENQDSHGVFVFDGFTLAIVCDGMGGHAGGAEASRIAVRAIWEAMADCRGRPVGPSLQKAIMSANEAIYTAARKHRRFMGMGTTVVAVALEGKVAHIAHVGDSRLYAMREGEAHLLTRDHTMVNLFVEAELLSPEDAAAHPEAHVLARSLGVESTVEVDLQDPLELEEGDVLFLCSDGVSGPVDDARLGALDWTSLPAACERVLALVREERGDDNATVVALGVDLKTSPDVPPTPPPAPVDLERKVQEAEEEAGERDDRNEPRAPMLYEDAQAAQAEAEGALAAQLVRTGESDEVDEIGDEGSRVGELGLEPLAPEEVLAPPPIVDGRRTLVLALAVLITVVCAGGVGGVLVSGGAGRILEPQAAEVTLLTPVGEPTTAPAVAALADVDPLDSDAPAEAGDRSTWVFEPHLPVTRRRFSHRARQFVQPPPGGPLQLDIVSAAREAQCGRALDATRRAMRQSKDYGALYNRVWECFDDHHHTVLANAVARTPEEFKALLPHFEGAPAEDSALPAWYRPPTDGIEFRLAGLAQSTEADRFAEAMRDLRGSEAVADQVMRDLMLEVQAASGLARTAEPTAEVVQWWARRVFHTVTHLRSPIGASILEFRPEQHERIVILLDEATQGAWTDRARLGLLPDPVREAVLVGSGEQAAPTQLQSISARPTPRPVPVAPVEPDPEDLKPRVIRMGPD